MCCWECRESRGRGRVVGGGDLICAQAGMPHALPVATVFGNHGDGTWRHRLLKRSRKCTAVLTLPLSRLQRLVEITAWQWAVRALALESELWAATPWPAFKCWSKLSFQVPASFEQRTSLWHASVPLWVLLFCTGIAVELQADERALLDSVSMLMQRTLTTLFFI